MIEMDDRPVYIGGLDRSGKTTLAAFLTSHSGIAVPPTGDNLWTYFHRRFGNLDVEQNRHRAIEAVLRSDRVRALDLDEEELKEELLAAAPTYGRLFALPLQHYAARAGKRRWGAQSGLIERHADDLFEAYPRATIVHVVRDPRDRYVVARARSARGRGGIGPATARWRYSTRLAIRNLRVHPGRYLVVRFEDLVNETASTVRAVCQFIGEEFEPSMLEMGDAPRRRRRILEQRGGEEDGPLLSDEFIGIFAEAMSDDDLRFLQRGAGEEMRRFGYDPVPLEAAPLTDRARYLTTTWPAQQCRRRAWEVREVLGRAAPRLAGPRVDPRQMAVAEGAGAAR